MKLIVEKCPNVYNGKWRHSQAYFNALTWYSSAHQFLLRQHFKWFQETFLKLKYEHLRNITGWNIRWQNLIVMWLFVGNLSKINLWTTWVDMHTWVMVNRVISRLTAIWRSLHHDKNIYFQFVICWIMLWVNNMFRHIPIKFEVLDGNYSMTYIYVLVIYPQLW